MEVETGGDDCTGRDKDPGSERATASSPHVVTTDQTSIIDEDDPAKQVIPKPRDDAAKAASMASRQREVRASLSLEATIGQLRRLFKLKERLEAECVQGHSGLGGCRVDFAAVLLVASDLLIQHHGCPSVSAEEADRSAGTMEGNYHIELDSQDEEPVVKRLRSLRPVKINVLTTLGTLSELQKNLHLVGLLLLRRTRRIRPLSATDPSSGLEDTSPRGSSTFDVVDECLRFALSQLDLFRTTFFVDHREEELNKVDKFGICTVCREMGTIEFLGASVCQACAAFFADAVRKRWTHTLRCAKRNACFTAELPEVSCRHCRFQRCRDLGMVDEYYYTYLMHPVQFRCSACACPADDEEPIRTLLGHPLCGPCIEFFEESVEMNREFLHYRNKGVLKNVHLCKMNPSFCVIEGSLDLESRCPSCLWMKMDLLGLPYLYAVKHQVPVKGPTSAIPTLTTQFPVDFESEECSVCGVETPRKQWMGQFICEGCRSFLYLSMRFDIYLDYCCLVGEMGRLCPLVADIDGKGCKFCWFRRLEIEGLVDRWKICGGRPELWDLHASKSRPSIGFNTEDDTSSRSKRAKSIEDPLQEDVIMQGGSLPESCDGALRDS